MESISPESGKDRMRTKTDALNRNIRSIYESSSCHNGGARGDFTSIAISRQFLGEH